MATELNSVFEQLNHINVNLTKLSYEKRTPEKLKEKLNEATILYDKYISYIPSIEDQIKKKEISGENLLLVKYYCEKIKEIFLLITTFCSKTYEVSSDKPRTSGELSLIKSKPKMEFDLKLALSLLPVMKNDDVITTKQLIDGIEYYSSILSSSQCKKNLINFVLKNRLSQSAKLKLASNYDSVNDLLCDMNNILLPKKSYVSLQNKLQSLRQDNRTIDDYGSELSEIFMDLSIAQAGGNSENLKILQPLNEKQAIKRFADGLRNRRLGTIISARNFDSLKDAVQTAIDEEVASPSTSGDILSMRNHDNKNFRGWQRGRNFSRGPSHVQQYRGRGFTSNYRRPHFYRSSSVFRGRGFQHTPPPRGQPRGNFRGRYSNNYNNRFTNYGTHGMNRNPNIHILNEETPVNTENDPSIQQHKFFRE